MNTALVATAHATGLNILEVIAVLAVCAYLLLRLVAPNRS
jgi:hypothetical protein